MVGAGEVAQEKLHFILKSSPNASITVIAPDISRPVLDLFCNTEHRINIIQQCFNDKILDQFDLVIAATNIKSLNKEVYLAAKQRKIIINVADTPDLCDFYMGSIVTKGNLKIAISTNGKSPTFAKRFRQLLEDILPVDTDSLVVNLHHLRNKLHGEFAKKVQYLNEVTKSLIE